MPCNLYGPGDNFNLSSGHVLPALLRKVHEAKIHNKPEVIVWGTGKPLREFLYVDDLAEAALFCLEKYDDAEHINCGAGEDLSIRALAEMILKVVDYRGELRFDTSKPDGTPRKLMDSTKIRSLGWKPSITLEEGITKSYDWFLKSAYSKAY
jgi:GDP-L-fucose synthase